MPRGRPSRESVYARFEPAARDLQRLGGLPTPAESEVIWNDIWHSDAHNSTALEGNTLVLREVEELLDRGRAVGSKDLKDYLEVLGYGRAARWVYSQALTKSHWQNESLVTVTDVRQIHAETMGQVWDAAPHPAADSNEGPGSFRRHDIHPFSGGMTPPPWPDVPAQLTTWIQQTVTLGEDVAANRISPSRLPLCLAELHSAFERIHPFIDGNGRTGRLVLNLMLIRLGWPPAIIFKRSRKQYLLSLDRADKGDHGPLAELIARSVLENLERLVLPNIAGPARLVPLKSLANEEISYRALRQAALRGRLQADLASDGTWRSSGHAVKSYLANKHKRSPN